MFNVVHVRYSIHRFPTTDIPGQNCQKDIMFVSGRVGVCVCEHCFPPQIDYTFPVLIVVRVKK